MNSFLTRAAFLILVVRSTVQVSRCVAQPTTQQSEAPLVTTHDAAVGVTFDRPATWVTVDQPKNGDANVSFGQATTPVGFVQATLQISMQKFPGGVKVDVGAPPSATATAYKVLAVDGAPARLDAHEMPAPISNGEMLIVSTAKGLRLYTITMMYPKTERDAYLRLADTVCRSLKLQ